MNGMNLEEYESGRREIERQLDINHDEQKRLESIQCEINDDRRSSINWLERFSDAMQGVPDSSRTLQRMWDESEQTVKSYQMQLEKELGVLADERRRLEEGAEALETEWRNVFIEGNEDDK